ncbi:Hpt domain-containing protein [Paracoccus sp. MBLB3053]|uniref:Hpt domain-containing protein n=1 Tax=Paracoccus aurantius TaxID=3073814 RepID=A0ABU2HPZ9_9RHOB|nr:Hpt domain-containing protein [Paracoccus sp. MBLB3053]MDS9467127.1 Hpt domain-containing protein [Paracoccus sp. MBLB3053]
MLDWGRIHELREEVGEDEFSLILDLFLDEVEGVVMRLAGREPARLASDLHFLVGCARNLGFRSFDRICVRSERLACNDRADEIRLDELIACYASSKRALFQGLQADQLGEGRWRA